MNFFNFPVIGTRSVDEFTTCDDPKLEPSALQNEKSTGNWVFDRESVPRITDEYWFHSSSQLWFSVKRNTETDEIYDAEVLRG
jgi:sarcosine oxidase delta subunit